VPNAPIPAPVLISPANGSSFSNYPRTTTLKWAAVAGAASYNVDIEYYSGGWNVLTMATVASTSYTFDFIGGQPGRWRVQAVGTGGSGGTVVQLLDICLHCLSLAFVEMKTLSIHFARA